MWELLNLLFGVFGSLGLVFTVAVMYMTPEWKVKLLRMMRKDKNYGIVRIAQRGRRISKHVVDFNNNTAEIRGKVYVLPKDVWLEESQFPVVTFYHLDGVEPRELQMEPEETSKVKEPNILASVFYEIKARAEAGALLKRISLFQLLLIITVVVSLAAAALAFLSMNNSSAALEAIHKFTPIIKG